MKLFCLVEPLLGLVGSVAANNMTVICFKGFHVFSLQLMSCQVVINAKKSMI